MSLSTKVINAVAKARMAVTDLCVTGTLTSKTDGTYDPSTGAVTSTSTTSTVTVFTQDYSQFDLLNSLIQSNDLKVSMFNDGVTPKISDTITINSIVYDIISVQTQFVTSTAVLFSLQCRK